MPIPFSCPRCGKKLKAPDDAVGKTSRCPGCGTEVTCPEPIYDAELIDAPPGETEPYHDREAEPADALAGSGSGKSAAPEAPSGEARRPCPMCGEMIVATAVRCRFCGEIFDPALKKATARARRGGADDETLTTGDLLVGLLCSWIGCIFGVLWMVQGKPKGWKMLLLCFFTAIFTSLAWNFVMRRAVLPR